MIVQKFGEGAIFGAGGRILGKGYSILKRFAPRCPGLSHLLQHASSADKVSQNLNNFSKTGKVASTAKGKDAAKAASKAKAKTASKPAPRTGVRSICAEDIPKGSKLEYVKTGTVKFDGVEFRGVPKLDHMSEERLRQIARTGESLKDVNGQILVGHHHKQKYHRSKGGFIILLPADRHKIGNRAQHPYGTQKGAGLTPAERADWDKLRPNFNKAWALTELLRRGLPI